MRDDSDLVRLFKDLTFASEVFEVFFTMKLERKPGCLSALRLPDKL